MHLVMHLTFESTAGAKFDRQKVLDVVEPSVHPH